MNSYRTLAGRTFILTLVFLVTSSLALAGDSGEKTKKVKKGFLGVNVQTVTPELAKDEDLSVTSGAYVQDVTTNSPADKAGIIEEDVILSFAGTTIKDADDLTYAVRKTAPGTEVSVELQRGKEKKTLKVTVGKLKESTFTIHIPDVPPIPKLPHFNIFKSNFWVMGSGGELMGISMKTLNEQLAEYFEAPGKAGVLVQQVEKNSKGATAGFKAGDVIIRIGNRSIEDMDDVRKAMNKYNTGDKAEVEVLRKGVKKVLTLEVENCNEYEEQGMLQMDHYKCIPSHNGAHVTIQRY